MTKSSKIKHLENLIEEKMQVREKLMIEFEDAPTPMESHHDHTRQDIATEISAIDHAIQDMREVIHQLENLTPEGNQTVQLGHTVELEIDEYPERFLLLNGFGGITMGDVTTLSTNTPIGKAIFGKSVNDKVAVKTPHGNLHVRIISIE